MKLSRLCLVIFLIALLTWSLPAYGQSDMLPSIKQRVQRFQDRYGIPLFYKDIRISGSHIQFTPVTEEEYRLLNDFLAFFESEINKYPPGFFKDRQVHGIGLVTRLFSQDRITQGLYSSQARVMFFDIDRFSNNKPLIRHGIHHEIFHMMAMQTPGYQLNDEGWATLNPKGFVYGEAKYSPTKSNPYNPHAPAQPGFVTDYAMTSVEEDKAEVFACLMQKANRKLIMQWAVKDNALRKKIQVIKDFVEVYCPDMSETYWTTSATPGVVGRSPPTSVGGASLAELFF